MNTGNLRERLSPLEHAALIDAAKAHAHVLRAEAIDAFWVELAARARGAWHALRRRTPVSAVRVPQGASACPR